MCQRCADNTGDQRKAAFQPIFTVTWISQAQAKQGQRDAEVLMHLETTTVMSEEDARSMADTLEDDPEVFRFTIEKTAVCLN